MAPKLAYLEVPGPAPGQEDTADAGHAPGTEVNMVETSRVFQDYGDGQFIGAVLV